MDKLSNLEFFRKVAETGETPAQGSRFIYPPAIAKTLGFRLTEVGPGTATMNSWPILKSMPNPMERCTAECCATLRSRHRDGHATSLKDDESFTSIDLQINFFRPVWNGRIRAIAKPVNVGRQISRYVCDILEMTTNWLHRFQYRMTLRGDQASGR